MDGVLFKKTCQDIKFDHWDLLLCMTDTVLSKEERRALAVQKLAKAFGRNDTTRRNASDEKEALLQILNAPDLEESRPLLDLKTRR